MLLLTVLSVRHHIMLLLYFEVLSCVAWGDDMIRGPRFEKIESRSPLFLFSPAKVRATGGV